MNQQIPDGLSGWVVAIDGPAGVGKSTIAKRIAEVLGFYFLNSGNFYRVVTLAVLQQGLDPWNDNLVLETGRNSRYGIVGGRMHLSKTDVEDLLHSQEIDTHVARHSAIVELRHEVNDRIRALVSDGMNIVAEGRDMTTVVFPHAQSKFFLDASPAVRARRRYAQQQGHLSLVELQKAIEERDYIDRNKAEGALRIASKAMYIDTSYLTIDEVCDTVLRAIFAEIRTVFSEKQGSGENRGRSEGSGGNTGGTPAEDRHADDAAGGVPQIS